MPETYAVGFQKGKAVVLQRFREWASTHPDPVISDELWGFVNTLENESMRRNK